MGNNADKNSDGVHDIRECMKIAYMYAIVTRDLRNVKICLQR